VHYTPCLWLPDAHSQTIYPATLAPKPRVAYQRERWETPDGDFIDLDWVASTFKAREQPLVVLFHGLEGSSGSHYARALMASCETRGWRAVVCHFRGCSGEPNRLARAYHSGDSAEADWVLARLAQEHCNKGQALFAAGVSLGGNMLAKYLGEQERHTPVRAAAIVSAPLDLHAGAMSLASGFNRLYTQNFLTTLKRKSLEKWARFPDAFDKDKMLAARDFFDFDGAVTAPLHGFSSAMDYWTRSSCKPFLASIAIPCLVLNARNDPFLPAYHLPTQKEVSASVLLEQPAKGGHTGFLTGPPPGRLTWLSERLLQFFEASSYG
jgi:uncharacterized protein